MNERIPRDGREPSDEPSAAQDGCATRYDR